MDINKSIKADADHRSSIKGLEKAPHCPAAPGTAMAQFANRFEELLSLGRHKALLETADLAVRVTVAFSTSIQK